MLTCIKHRINYEHGECPTCKRMRENVCVTYSSDNPEHKSSFIFNKIKELNKLTKKLEKINKKVEGLLTKE